MPAHTLTSAWLQLLGLVLQAQKKNQAEVAAQVPPALLQHSSQSSPHLLQQQLEWAAFVPSSIHTQRNKIFYQSCLQSDKRSEQNDVLLGKREADCKAICWRSHSQGWVLSPRLIPQSHHFTDPTYIWVYLFWTPSRGCRAVLCACCGPPELLSWQRMALPAQHWDLQANETGRHWKKTLGHL